MMETYYNSILISVAIVALVVVWRWKVWPLVKDWLIKNKAYDLVLLMEESFGGGTGEVKFEVAVGKLQEYVDKKGWKVDLALIYDYVTAAVGRLHAQQGEKPPVLDDLDPDNMTDDEIEQIPGEETEE